MAPSAITAEIHVTDEDRSQLREARQLIDGGSVLRVLVGDEAIELPSSVVDFVSSSIKALDDGDTLMVVREEIEVSPAAAAVLLGVSRQYVDRLVAAEVLPVRRLPHSRYRKIPVRAVLAHKAAKERKRAGIEHILAAADDAGLEY